MTSSSWNALGDVSAASSIATLAVQGVVAAAVHVGYRSVGSPHSSLRETWDTLLSIKTRLEAVSTEQRKKIEAAAVMKKCRSLTDIEDEFQNLWDLHAEISLKYEQSSYIQRHLSGPLRTMINTLEADVKALLVDTWTTARAQAVLPSPPPPLPDSTDIIPASQATSPSSPVANRESIEMNAV